MTSYRSSRWTRHWQLCLLGGLIALAPTAVLANMPGTVDFAGEVFDDALGLVTVLLRIMSAVAIMLSLMLMVVRQDPVQGAIGFAAGAAMYALPSFLAVVFGIDIDQAESSFSLTAWLVAHWLVIGLGCFAIATGVAVAFFLLRRSTYRAHAPVLHHWRLQLLESLHDGRQAYEDYRLRQRALGHTDGDIEEAHQVHALARELSKNIRAATLYHHDSPARDRTLIKCAKELKLARSKGGQGVQVLLAPAAKVCMAMPESLDKARDQLAKPAPLDETLRQQLT